MGGCFLDTTIVIHVSEVSHPDKEKGITFISSNQPAEMPYYALKELLNGRVRILCEAHNAVLAAENHAEALLALINRSPAEGRKRIGRIEDLAKSLERVFNSNPAGDRKHLKREILQDLALVTSRLWRNAHRINSVSITQSLACFNDGKLTYGTAGELRGPQDNFNCKRNERCSAAAYLYDNKSVLQAMIDSLHSKKLESALANKNETKQRRRAMKELLSKGPKSFNKRLCRALGDAYFAAMCPSGSTLVTSNMEDYIPLCHALRKEVKIP